MDNKAAIIKGYKNIGICWKEEYFDTRDWFKMLKWTISVFSIKFPTTGLFFYYKFTH